MHKYKKIAILASVLITTLYLVACGEVKKEEIVNTDESAANQQENNGQTIESTNLEPAKEEPINEEKSVANQQDDATAAAALTDAEMTSDELLDLFINGSVSAVDSADLTSTFYITDLNMDSEEWDAYSVGEKVDLDNDGENELILCGPYGGIYLDARDNKVYKFAAGEGNALMLSYVVYNGSVWIMYSNRMNAGYESYHMEQFEGADNLVAEMNFSEEPVDENNIDSGMKYTLNGSEISYDEYYELGSKIFATEESTD